IARKIFEQLENVERRISSVVAGHDSVVTVWPPTEQRRAVVAIPVLHVPQIPPEERIEFRLRDLSETVREIQAVDEAGRLLSGAVRKGIVFRAKHFHVRVRVAEIS